MQLVAGQLLIDMLWTDDIVGPYVAIVKLLGVVGHINFTPAFDLPVVLVWGAVIHVFLVNRPQRRGIGQVSLIGQVR
jgi:hypothetical protein